MAAVKRIVKTYCFTRRCPAPWLRLRGSRLQQVARASSRRRARSTAPSRSTRTSGLGAADEARRVDDRRGDAGARTGRRRGRPRRCRRASPARPRAAIAGGLAGEVRARDGERTGLLEELEGDAVGRHPHRDGALRLAEIPRQRRLRRQDDREPAGPELPRRAARRARAPPRRARAASSDPATSTGGGDWRPRPFASSSRCDGLARRTRRRRRRRRCRSGGRRARRGRWPGAPGACR